MSRYPEKMTPEQDKVVGMLLMRFMIEDLGTRVDHSWCPSLHDIDPEIKCPHPSAEEKE